MFCQNCGNNVKDTDIYCPYCGSKIERGDKAPEVKPVSFDEPVNKMKWVQPVMIPLFIVTLLLWFLGFFLYVIITVLTVKDPLDLSNYINLTLPIIQLVLSVLCLSLGIFFKVKKYQTVKNIVAGALGTIASLIAVLALGLASGYLNKAPKLSLGSEYYLDMKVVEPLVPTQFDSKVFLVEGLNEDGEMETVPAYIYLKFTSNAEIALFEAEIENSTRWNKAEVSKKKVIDYDYYLVYNYETKKFDSSDLANSFILFYAKEYHSMVMIPGVILSYFAALEDTIQ